MTAEATSISGMIACSVCGTISTMHRTGTCESPQLIGPTVYWDYMNCPNCGCQILLNKRLVDIIDLSLPTDNSNHCVCCGAVIPEGRMVCPTCERRAEE